MKIFALLFAALVGVAVAERTRPSQTVAALDVDGDGRADRVRLSAADGSVWLDVELAADGFGLVSTTRIAQAASLDGYRLCGCSADAVLVRGPRGEVSAWRVDGLAFVRVPELGAVAQAPVASSTTE